MLKNIELFDKLSLRFNGRVLFIKDVIGDEICCWSFYGQGRKIAEVCCTSIVYATEKKQTKVDILYNVHTLKSSLLLCEHRAAVSCLNIFLMPCVTLHFSPRWSSQRLESMRRPSTSSCMSPMMGGVQTMPCWRPQGALQGDLIIWMRTRSENELSEFVGFISNDRMTAHTTTSDLSPSTRQPVSLTPDSLCTTLVPYITQRLSVVFLFYQLFLQETTMT